MLRRYLNNTGLMWETAPRVGALIVFAEHRSVRRCEGGEGRGWREKGRWGGGRKGDGGEGAKRLRVEGGRGGGKIKRRRGGGGAGRVGSRASIMITLHHLF